MNTWIGRPIDEKNLFYSEINIDTIPTFRREPFSINGVENPYLDTIVHKNGTPVATVSKSYSLIQHHTALDATFKALESMGYTPKDAECELAMTSLGERMWLRVRFPQYSFDPGDRNKMFLELSVFNSVDRSLVFGFEGGWYRQVCANGMVALERGRKINKRHTASLSPVFIAVYLQKSITEVLREEDTYKEWREKKVTVGSPLNSVGSNVIEDWIDATVNDDWGTRTAARAYHIVRTGKDGEVNILEANDNKKTPHKVSVTSKIDVPGSEPAENALDVAHALSWIASRQETVQTRYEMMRDVPSLMNKLVDSL